MHDLLQAALTGALLGAFVAGLRWLLSRGGAPSREGEVIVYKPKPGVRVLGLLMLLAGLWLCGFAVVLTLRGGWQDAVWVLLFSVLPILLAALLALPRLTLDTAGLHHHRALLGSLHLPWNELSHYEINASPMVSVLLVRARNGQTVAISNRAFAVNHFLNKVVQKSGIARQPYRRQSWYKM